jgi:hypothetical protein
LTTTTVQFRSAEEDRKLREENPDTPELFAFDCGQLPFERMGDAHFELLLADLYAARADDGSEDWYDEARRLNDGADQGRDVILLDDSAPVGVIQCKRYNGIVTLAMMIQEICKFFLYATIKPGIASAPGEPFRYYVAVSDRAAGKLFEFMTGKGRKRFEDLRSEFEEKAFAARKGSATLRKHPALKSLTQAQLCDLVWARIDNLHTGLHKKDDLSRLVGAYPPEMNDGGVNGAWGRAVLTVPLLRQSEGGKRLVFGIRIPLHGQASAIFPGIEDPELPSPGDSVKFRFLCHPVQPC